ncbi:hypothetical protein FQA39_LY08868 [Lamprigera yunnana]|nr:hypothetical protein FQA39_LY08868 [Lamprigera yunnana]
MINPGTIIEIIVKDFMTYSYVKYRPGKKLNLLLGPNGSGKSSMVAAIVLGFGGNSKAAGRGTKISDYVKNDCEEATIEIKLQGRNEDEKITIKRIFDLSEKSSWFLNHKKVAFKDVDNIIKQFNVQIDNLCQFLPQDKVQEFARLNKQQLLQQTQIALCRYDLLEKQTELINLGLQQKNTQTCLQQQSQKLKDLSDANSRLEGRVENLEKKEKYDKVIENIERKMAWVKYQHLRVELDDIKEDKKKISETYNNDKTTLKSLQTEIRKAENAVATDQQKILTVSATIRKHESVVNCQLEKASHIRSNKSKIVGDFKAKILEIDKRGEEISKVNDEISVLNCKRAEIVDSIGSDEKVERQMKSYIEDKKKITMGLNKTAEMKVDLESKKRNKMYEIQRLENELRNLESVKQRRLEWLRQKDRDTFTAVQWLRNNKHIMKGEVFEPMLLEVNVLNPKHAIFVENTIPVRDRLAITCVEKEDMNKLILIFRDQQNLKVNIVHSGIEQPGLNTYQPVMPIEQLRHFGMFAYVRSLLTAPEPIMKYLCKTYQIHNTPVGNDATNQCFDDVPSKIKTFFSDTFRFSTSYSKYTGQKSTRQVQLKGDGSFGVTINTEHIENLRSQLGEFGLSCRKIDDSINSLATQITQFNQNLMTIQQNVQSLKGKKLEIDAIDRQLRLLNGKLQHLQSSVTKEEIQSEYNSEIKQCLDKMVSVQSKIKDAFSQYSNVVLDSELDKINLEMNSKKVAFLQNKSKDLQILCQKTEETYNCVKIAYTNAIAESKKALSNAKQLSKGFTPADLGFAEFRDAYDSLSDELFTLESEKEHIETKVNCLNTADIDELQEYQKRKKDIAAYEDSIKQSNTNLRDMDELISVREKEWLEPLGELVERINEKFGISFRSLNCAGEVTVCRGENVKDFANYGISIKVKYRDSQPLQELNSTVQSGGERAVATAIYMLSLQELTAVPFRCVDEINQGMDAINERRIFEILVETVTMSNTQYFFITPKLIPNLEFVRDMTIHLVHNGPFVLSEKKCKNIVKYAKQAKQK